SETTLALSELVGALANLQSAGELIDDPWGDELELHPAVDSPLKSDRIHVSGRRYRVKEPALELHPALRLGHGKLGVRMCIGVPTDGALVNKRKVGEIEQVVDD